MTRAALKKRLAALESALSPPQAVPVVFWHWETAPDDDAPTVYLQWPEGRMGGDSGHSGRTGLPKAG